MNQPGKIVIKDNKVYFEPKGLEKPDRQEYYVGIIGEKKYSLGIIAYNQALKEYEASKQLVEVSNWIVVYKNNDSCKMLMSKIDSVGKHVLNNQKCEAEVENNVATIIKIN